MAHREHALSEIVGLMLISFLVIVLALFMVGVLTGVLTTMLEKSALLTVTASPYDDPSGNNLIRLNHKEGNPVNLAGSSHSGGVTEIVLTVTDSAGNTFAVGNPPGAMSNPTWGPGQALYIYSDGTSLRYYDQVPGTPGSLGPGVYTIKIVDQRANILLHSLPVTIT